MKYAIFAEASIFGIGDSPAAAWRDAEEWMDRDYKGARCFPCTVRLAALVQSFGGSGSDVDFEEVDGVLMTAREAAAR